MTTPFACIAKAPHYQHKNLTAARTSAGCTCRR